MRKFTGYVIITDLDGTFLGAHASLVERNREAVDYFKSEGGIFTFATGRAHYNMKVAIPNPEDYVNAPIIANNGCYLYDAKTDGISEIYLLDREKAYKAAKYAVEKYPDLFLRVTSPEGFLVETLSFSENMMKKLDPKYIKMMPMEEFPDRWLKCVFLGAPELIEEFVADITPKFPEFEYARSAKNLYELQKKGVSKGTALLKYKKKLEDEYGIPMTVIAAGDYGNDLEMLRVADIAVAPENAIDEVKAEVDYVLCKNTEGLMGDIVELIESKLIK